MAVWEDQELGQRTIGGATAPAPPVDFSGNPVFVPRPQPVVVDRQAYLTQQLEAQRRAQAEALARLEQQRIMGSREWQPDFSDRMAAMYEGQPPSGNLENRIGEGKEWRQFEDGSWGWAEPAWKHRTMGRVQNFAVSQAQEPRTMGRYAEGQFTREIDEREQAGREELRRRVMANPAIQIGLRAQQEVARVDRMAEYEKVNVADFGYDQANPATFAEAERKARAEAKRRYDQGFTNVRIVYPNEDQTLAQGAAQFAQEFATVANNANPEIPGLKQLQDKAINAGEALGEASRIPYGREIGGGIAGAVVPDTPVGIALEFVGGNLVGDAAMFAARRIVRAAEAAGVDLTPAGIRAFAKSEQGQSLIKQLQSEEGRLGKKKTAQIVPKTSDELAKAWDVLPPENQKLVGTIAEKTMSDRQRNALIAASRSRKAGNIAEIFAEPGTPDEKLAKAWAARRGADAPTQTPLREFFEDSEIASFKQQIVDAGNSRLVTQHEATNAGSILNLLLDGTRNDGTRRLISQGERALMGKIFGPELMKVLPTTPEKMSLWQKFAAPFQLWRSAKTAFDVGAMFRQGRKVIFSDPKEWLNASRTQFRALGQKGYERVMEQVHNAPYYSLGQSLERPLGILEQGSGLADEFLSPITKKIPGLNVSERTYNSFLNTLRQSIFDKNVDQLVKQAGGDINRVPVDELQRIADNINTATMFGNISKLGDWHRALGQTLFSVRGLVSQPQFYADFIRAMGPNASPAARKIIATRTASAIASDLAILGAVAYTGAYLKEHGSPVDVKVDLDPFSQTLGDAKIGPIKWNPWGPEAQFVRAIIQASWGKQQREGEAEPRDINAFDRTKSFARTKLSPMASVVYDLFLNDQKDFRGRPIKDRAWEYAAEQASPIMGYAMYDAFREEGFWGAGELGQALGFDVQVYGPSETVQKAEEKKELDQAKAEPLGLKVHRGEYKFNSDEWLKDDAWRNPLARDVGVEPEYLDRYESIEDLKADYIKWVEPEIPVTEDAGEMFEALPTVKDFRADEKAELLRIWTDNPQLLLEALQAGRTEQADYKTKILKEAGLIE